MNPKLFIYLPDRCLAARPPSSDSFLELALDARTGAVLWQTRTPKWVYTHGYWRGKTRADDIVYHVNHGLLVLGYNATTGALLWR